jgi:hypothetical protein
MVEFSRRSIILGAAGITAGGAGITTATSGLRQTIAGQADIQAEQALTVTDLTVSGGDASFARTSDDNTSFQAAIELNNGDEARFHAQIKNSATDLLSIQLAVDAPDVINVTVRNDGENEDITNNTVRTGEETFVARIPADDSTHSIRIDATLDDTADPGSYNIGAVINPLSTDADLALRTRNPRQTPAGHKSKDYL